ncbi:uncharacterized protein LOC133881135 [Alnus glutinosa]|uniref:uncharacterized protein LOC133881135 n=1 Tax=Alnus glutinosa TaxID=3517 RepID=UPI002D772BA1|nr:uncharacterized protein LOC133881135 [Alnus glutinosa]
MESGGPSGEEDQWVHWEDLIDGLLDPDSDETDSQPITTNDVYSSTDLNSEGPNVDTMGVNESKSKNVRFVKITEQVATFLLIVYQGHTMRVVADRLQRSLETIHKYCHQTCRALCRLGKTVIQPTAKATPHPHVSSNGKFYPWFGNCIGAIDSTQIDAEVRGMSTVPYCSRKKKAMQNVMCVVNMDLCLTYVYAGWEGSAHDSRYFYLADSGYGCSMRFMPPYRNERYHLASFQGRRGGPRGKLETFNCRHSSLRSIVERAFGIMKRRFRILDRMNPYATDFQRLIIVACYCIHNFIRKDCGEFDELFKEALQQMYGEEWYNLSRCDHLPFVRTVIPGHLPDRSVESKRYMELYRDAMCESIWNSMHKD